MDLFVFFMKKNRLKLVLKFLSNYLIKGIFPEKKLKFKTNKEMC